MVRMLSQLHLVHTFPPWVLKILSNVLVPSMCTCFKWSLSFRFSNQAMVRIMFIVKLKFSLCLTKHYVMKAYGAVEV